jgi:hypothetical protein
MANLSEPVPISSIPSLNSGLSSAKSRTMIDVLGAPREPLVQDECRNDQASRAVTRLLETRRMTEHFRLTGIKPALDSVQDVIAKVKAAHPELIDKLRTDGMICVRHRKPTDGSFSDVPSNHSWGTAIDFKLAGSDAPGNTGTTVPRWVAILVPFFNQAGWFSGISFKDAMHFEVADETIRKWSREGLLGTRGADEPIVVAGGEGNAGESARPGASIFTPITGLFSQLFGRG